MLIIDNNFKAPDVDPNESEQNRLVVKTNPISYVDPISGAEAIAHTPLTGTVDTNGASPEKILQTLETPPVQETPVSNPTFDSITLDVKKDMEDNWLISDAAMLYNSSLNLIGKGYDAATGVETAGYRAWESNPDYYNGLNVEQKAELDTAHSEFEARRILRNLAVETNARKRLDDSGHPLLWALAGTATDPLTYTGNLGSWAGVGKAVAGAALQEGILANTQADYTFGDAAKNVAAASALIGGLGLMLNKVGGRSLKLQQLNESINDGSALDLNNQIVANNAQLRQAQGVGADVVDFDPKDYDIISTGISPAIIKQIQMPGIQRTVINSESARAREALFKLTDVSLSVRKNLRGEFDTSYELYQKQDINNNLIIPKAEMQKVYSEALHADPNMNVTPDYLNREIRTYAAMDDTTAQGPVRPYIERAGTILRNFYEDIAQRAVKTGHLENITNPRGAINYVSRVYDKVKIRARELDFKHQVSSHFRNKFNNLTPDESTKLLDDYGFDNVTDLANYAADSMYDHIIAGNDIISVTRKRAVDLSDLDLQEWFISDPFKLMENYYKGMGAKVLMKEKLGYSKFEDFTNDLRQEETDKKIAIKKSGKSAEWIAKEEARVGKEYEKLQENLKVLWDDLLFNSPKNNQILSDTSSVVKNVNVFSVMENVALSSIADAANVAIIHGVGPAIQEHMKALVSGVTRLSGNASAITAARDEMALIANATEKYTQLRTSQLLELVDNYDSVNTAVNLTRKMAEFTMDASGINLWTLAQKNTAGRLFVEKVQKTAEKLARGETLSKVELLDFTHYNMNEYWINKVADQIKTHSTDGVLNVEKWDAEVFDQFQQALIKVADDTVITPSKLDIPQLMKNPLVSMLLQFKYFMFAAHNKMVIAGLSRIDVNKMLVLSMYMGATGVSIKANGLIHGRKTPESWDFDDPNSWWYAIVERSGVGSLPLDIFNQGSAVFGVPKIGSLAHRVIDPNEKGGRSDHDWLRMFGPLGSQIDRVNTIGSSISNGTWNERSTDAVMNALPVNLPYAFPVIDQLMEGLENETGLPYKEKDTFLRK